MLITTIRIIRLNYTEMAKRCAWGLCNSDERYTKRLGAHYFIPFPKPKSQLQKCIRWIRACGRPHSQLNVDNINKKKYVCTKHFIGGYGPTPDYPDPVFAGIGKNCAPIRCLQRKRLRQSWEVSDVQDSKGENEIYADTNMENAVMHHKGVKVGTRAEEPRISHSELSNLNSVVQHQDEKIKQLKAEFKDGKDEMKSNIPESVAADAPVKIELENAESGESEIIHIMVQPTDESIEPELLEIENQDEDGAYLFVILPSDCEKLELDDRSFIIIENEFPTSDDDFVRIKEEPAEDTHLSRIQTQTVQRYIVDHVKKLTRTQYVLEMDACDWTFLYDIVHKVDTLCEHELASLKVRVSKMIEALNNRIQGSLGS